MNEMLEIVYKARENIATVRAMQFEGEVDNILEEKLIHTIIRHYGRKYGIPWMEFDEIFEELYGVEGYMEDFE